MTRRIPRTLAEECFRVVAGDSIRRRFSIEFDVLTWKEGIKLPEFHPETEPVPDPTGPKYILEVLVLTNLSGGLFGGSPTSCLSPVFIPAVYTPSDSDPSRILAYWSSVTFPRMYDQDVINDDPGRGVARVKGSWRVWPSAVLVRALDHYRVHGREMGVDHLTESVREAIRWLD